MAIVEPSQGRAIVETYGNDLRITIPAATQPAGVAILGMWLTFWVFGGVMIAGDSLNGRSHEGTPFTIAWFAIWTLASAWVIYVLLWQVVGKEIIELTSSSLRQRKHVAIFSRSKEYAVANVRNLRLAPRRQNSIRANM
jgi:hypothetical protein